MGVVFLDGFFARGRWAEEDEGDVAAALVEDLVVLEEGFCAEFGGGGAPEIFGVKEDEVELVGFVAFCAVDAWENGSGSHKGADEVLVCLPLPCPRRMNGFDLVSVRQF
jgi:hypothetical protein